MRKGRLRHTEHENSERWLLTYADLITLLLGLFVILYAMSKVDATKYAKVVTALGGVFGSSTSAGVGTGGTDSAGQGHGNANSSDAIQGKVRAALYQDINSDLVTLSSDKYGITVHLTEELLFASGSATLKASSLATLDLLVAVLKTIPNEVRIEGHTDDVPINTSQHASNWHLSVARAMNTGYYLMNHHGLEPKRISIVGSSQYKPLSPNTSEKSRARNRRVDIVIVSGGVAS